MPFLLSEFESRASFQVYESRATHKQYVKGIKKPVHMATLEEGRKEGRKNKAI
jgi:hypothetical protein